MRYLAFLLLAAATAAITAEAAEKARGDATKTAGANLDGVWTGFVVEGKGEQPDRGSVRLELTIEGNRIRAKRLDGQAGVPPEGVFRVANGMIDAAETQGRAKGRVYQGIFAATPEQLRWCVSTPGNKRPRTFETRGTQFLLILKRQKT